MINFAHPSSVSFKEWYVKLSTIFAIGDTVSDTMHFTPKACASMRNKGNYGA